MDWKIGDWAVFERSVVQIKKLEEGGFATVSDSFFETSGKFADRLRPLTLKNKRIAETFETYYKRLDDINGNAGFNYPDISRYFSQLALSAIDGDEKDQSPYEKAQEFVHDARAYTAVIQGIPLFRPKLRGFG